MPDILAFYKSVWCLVYWCIVVVEKLKLGKWIGIGIKGSSCRQVLSK